MAGGCGTTGGWAVRSRVLPGERAWLLPLGSADGRSDGMSVRSDRTGATSGGNGRSLLLGRLYRRGVHYNDETPGRLPGATKRVRAGVDLDVGQALLGYASLACTTVYLHARDEDKRRAVESWPRVGGIGERLLAAHRWCIRGRVAACGRAGMAGVAGGPVAQLAGIGRATL